MKMYIPIAVMVFMDVVYQLSAKQTPAVINPFASLTVTYFIGSVLSAVMFFATSRGGSLFREWHSLNWAAFVLGFAVVGLEAGNVYMYRVGWNVNTGYVVKSILSGIALLIAGYLVYREQLTVTKTGGIAVCMLGLYLINK